MAHALVVLDCQPGVVARHDPSGGAVRAVHDAVRQTRDAAIPPIFVTLALRPEGRGISSGNRGVRLLSAAPASVEGDDRTRVVTGIRRAPADVEIVKRRIGAFIRTDLDLTLRAHSTDTLVFAGFATSGAVLSTLRHAADLDYRLIVLADACGDADQEVHEFLITKIVPRQAVVTTVADWAQELATGTRT